MVNLASSHTVEIHFWQQEEHHATQKYAKHLSGSRKQWFLSHPLEVKMVIQEQMRQLADFSLTGGQ